MAHSRSRLAIIPVLFTVAALLGGVAIEAAAKNTGKPYKAKISWTSFGIPHVRASDWGGLGYGYGYAFARDNLCTLALDVVESEGRLSRFFGSGPDDDNLRSDAVWALYNSDEVAAEGFAELEPDMQQLVRGYARGYNRYLRDTGISSLPTACRDADWVREIDEFDMLKVLNKLTLRAGVGNFINPIFDAQPPSALTTRAAAFRAAPAAQAASKAEAERLLEQTKLPSWDIERNGSNAVALGSALTDDGGGALLGNPHFPWFGINRFHAVHLTIPGRYDAMGAAIYGFPLVSIGFNRHLAWSHTVSTARRFVVRELKLAPGDPTSYIYDGEVVPMTTDTVSVDVLQPDGSVVPVNHTFYSSQFGVMLVLPPIAGWSGTTAYAFTDVNVGNVRGLNQSREMGSARSMAEFTDAIEKNLALPWVNTIAADRAGHAYYGDISTVPHVSDAKLDSCANTFVALVLSNLRVYTLDGSTSACDLGTDPDAPQPGLFGAANLPSINRDDFAQNSNNSYWLANPAQKLEGYPQIIGADEGEEQNLRTRLGLTQIQDRKDGNDGLAGEGFGQQWLQDVLYQNRHHSAELLLPGVLTLCAEEDNDVDIGGGVIVNVSEACGVLLAWDATNNPDRVGPHIWRELYNRINGIPVLYAVPFDVNDPVNTPRDLNIGDPAVRDAVMSGLGSTVQLLSDVGIELDRTWGSVHFDTRGGDIFPIHGGRGGSGVYNAISSGGPIDDVGYTPIFAGSSYIQAVRWQKGWPVAQAIVTYSQSTDPDSPHFSDMTQVFSDQGWVAFPYQMRDIKKDQIGAISLSEKR